MQEQDLLVQEKAKIEMQLMEMSEKIRNHQTAAHDWKGECTKSLKLVDLNIQCIVEDLATWTDEDRTSYLKITINEGSCEEGCKLIEETKEILNLTGKWVM